MSDDFSDGDIVANPAWLGTSNQFLVNDKLELQLSAVAAGQSWLSTQFQSQPSDALQWEFVIKQSFSPSGANFSRFYLVSDEPDLSDSLQGYYLQFGEAGSADAVELFRQSGLSSMSICRGTAGAIASAFAIRVRVTYDGQGNWLISVDHSAGEEFALEATCNDSNELSGSYAGLLCRYTISNATRFVLDDVRISVLEVPDTVPPRIDRIEVTSSESLNVFFSEPLSAESIHPDHFAVDGVRIPIAAALDSSGRVVSLAFADPFVNGVPATLKVGNLRDVFENEMASVEVPFLFFEERPVGLRDVIISEFMADPFPTVGLPDAEFVELYNRSENPVNLSKWILSDASSSVEIPYYILLPNGRVILSGAEVSEDFRRYGSVVSLEGMPALNNTGDVIALTDDAGTQIDSLSYTDLWYRSGEKAEGGWSLEIIDPEDFCGQEENWRASEAIEGGTPGSHNSVHASRPDNMGPVILSVIPLDSVTLVISFSEKLDAVLPSAAQFEFDTGAEISSVRFSNPSRTKILLTLEAPLEAGKVYTLRVVNIYDCPGNRISPDRSSADFLLPERAVAGDLVVNEVLFNPRPSGVDFIEVYNPSGKVVDLQNWSLRNAGSASAETFPISRDPLLIYPANYVVLTSNRHIIKGEYIMGVEEAFFETEIPPLNDDEGYVSLLDSKGLLIDSIYYSENLHAPFLKDDEGVSLERISDKVAGTENSNWRSASSTSGFATPGYVNSNTRTDVQLEYGSIAVEPEVIQQGVAQHDFARVRYRFIHGGLIANIRVFDQQGRAIRTLADNEMLGTDGFFRWDGDLENGMAATIGYYLVWVEVFDSDGRVTTFRKGVAVF